MPNSAAELLAAWLVLPGSLLLAHALGSLIPRVYTRMALHPRGGYAWQLLSFHWVHGNWRHLLLNVTPLLLLTLLIALQGVALFWVASGCILLVAGAGTWAFSTARRVAGASGMVFGYWGYILASAAISRELAWVAAAAVTLLFYAGLWTLLTELTRGVSWSCHVFGLAGGVAAALLLAT